MRTNIALTGLLVLTIAGCTEPGPIVTGFNGDSVEIQQFTFIAQPDASLPEIQSEAARICGKVGKAPEYASSRVDTNTSTTTHLFLCL